MGRVGTTKRTSSKYLVNIKVGKSKQKLQMKIDTGAEVTIIGLLYKFGLSREDLIQSNRRLVGPDKHKFKCFGCITPTLQ